MAGQLGWRRWIVLGLLPTCACAAAPTCLVLSGAAPEPLLSAVLARLAAPGRLGGVDVMLLERGVACLPRVPVPYRSAADARESVYPRLAAAARAAEVPLGVGLELLRYGPHAPPPMPAWIELGWPQQPPVAPRGEAYLSPFHPAVSAAIDGVVDAVSALAPRPARVVLDYRLPADELLGFSTAARVACIRGLSQDAIDLFFETDLQLWLGWRGRALAERFGQITRRVREKLPGVPVVARVTGAYHTLKVGRREWSGDNWLAWLADGLCDEVLLDAQWNLGVAADEFLLLKRFAQERGQAEPLARMRVLVRTRGDDGKLALTPQLKFLESRGATPDRLVYCPMQAEDLDAIPR
jgi:hypothetical protein